MKDKKKRKKGFTLVEVIVVLVILAILAVILIPAFYKYIDKANEKACLVQRGILKQHCETAQTLYYKNDLSIEDAFKTVEIQGELSEYKCPSDGTIYAKGNEIMCTAHDDKENDGAPKWNQNYAYKSDGTYSKGKNYKYGQIVERNGVLYMCLDPDKSSKFAPGLYTTDSMNTWQAVGTSNQSAVSFALGNHYALGTVVTDGKGNYYMFTPPYNDTRNYSNYGLSNSSVWTKISSASATNRAPMIVGIPANVKAYSNNRSYSKGDYCTVNGCLYKYTGNKSGKIGISYSSVNNGTWSQVSKTFLYENAKYKKGDKVWYKGKYYTAKSDFTTYSGFGVPKSDSPYWSEK